MVVQNLVVVLSVSFCFFTSVRQRLELGLLYY